MKGMTYEQALTQLEWGERNGKIETFYFLPAGDADAVITHFCTECENSSHHYEINGIEGCGHCQDAKTAAEAAA